MMTICVSLVLVSVRLMLRGQVLGAGPVVLSQAMDVDPDVNEILAAFPAVRKWLERLRETPGAAVLSAHRAFKEGNHGVQP